MIQGPNRAVGSVKSGQVTDKQGTNLLIETRNTASPLSPLLYLLAKNSLGWIIIFANDDNHHIEANSWTL